MVNIYLFITDNFRLDRDAQLEGRIDHPTYEDITFSPTVTVVDDDDDDNDDVLLGIPDTQLHDPRVLTNLNNNRPTYFVIDHENGTLYVHENEDVIPQNQNIGENVLQLNRDDISEIALDDTHYNINSLNSIQPQDDIHLNDSSEDEDAIIDSESDDEYDSSDENEQRDEILESNQNVSGDVHTNDDINQTNSADEERTRTGTIVSLNEVVEARNSSSVEDTNGAIEGAISQVPVLNEQRIAPVDSSSESNDTSIN
ncbi:unnamed protein product [Rotaria sp. Silwood1]|nr:unnamed protein product [Rotaria sp. Silwood1]